MKKYITPELAEQIKQVDLFDTINEIVELKKESGQNFKGECPMCHSNALSFNRKKGIYKCFKCDFGGNNPANFVMQVKNIDYNEALQYLAGQFNIIIPTEPHPSKKPKEKAKDTSFKNRQLESSGLTTKDVKGWEHLSDDKQVEIDVFSTGTISQNNRIIPGDDMVIYYLDLDGKRIKYQVKNEKTEREFYRVRWQFPESHLDRSGKPKKYESPINSSVTLFIPETIRKIYREGHQTKRLFFTEGEKKAEKMCKHGLPAFGMPGINALVGKDKSFPESVVRVLEKCDVKEVFFVLDSDYKELSKKLHAEKDITERSRMFFYAVKNFRDWFQTLANRGIYLELYLIGGVGEQKGVDDLLASFPGREDEYKTELERQINAIAEERSPEAQFFNLYKISTISDLKLRDIWNLNDKKAFCDQHADILRSMPEFKYGRNMWRYNGDEIELAQPLLDDEKFYNESFSKHRDGTDSRNLEFDYVKMKKFFRNRGFHRLENHDRPNELIRVEDNVITVVDHIKCRDYAMDLAEELFDTDVQNMLIKGSTQYFGPEKINQLSYYDPHFFDPDKLSEYLFFKNKYWKISATGIEEKNIKELNGNIWAEQLKQYDASRTDRLVNIEKLDEVGVDGAPNFNVVLTKTGKKCDFAGYLWVTSFHKWELYFDENRHLNGTPVKAEHLYEANIHFISKMCAIGYLLHQYRDKNCEKAVIGMDAKISEVGESNGRSGKSLFGFALSYVKNQAYIDAKRTDMEQDRFLWQEVSRKTENIFIDDVRVNFDFEMLFTVIVGRLTVEGKGSMKYTLKDNDVPKIYLTTNHAINGSTSSHKDRQFKIAFSDFFDDEYKPFEYFGKSFFFEWNEEQWNLFYNFMAECLEFYFIAQKNGWGINQSGLIAAPCQNIERRQCRQEMGEAFFSFMNDFMDITEDIWDINTEKFNTKHERIPLYNLYIDKHPIEKKYCNAQKFWKKLVNYCNYYGFRLNPVQGLDARNKPAHDKTNGTEYITIANRWFDSLEQ